MDSSSLELATPTIGPPPKRRPESPPGLSRVPAVPTALLVSDLSEDELVAAPGVVLKLAAGVPTPVGLLVPGPFKPPVRSCASPKWMMVQSSLPEIGRAHV